MRTRRVAACPRTGTALRDRSLYQRRSTWLTSRRIPSTPIPSRERPGSAAGEKGDSIEEGRKGSQADDEKDDGDD